MDKNKCPFFKIQKKFWKKNMKTTTTYEGNFLKPYFQEIAKFPSLCSVRVFKLKNKIYYIIF